MQDKFLPGRHLITKFGEGGFYFGGMSHQGSLLITPSGMRALSARDIIAVTLAELSALSAEKGEVDFLLIGTGQSITPIPSILSGWLKTEAIPFDVMDTAAALRTYNVVLAEDRRVAAILIAVD
jgi:uncharacterized protein